MKTLINYYLYYKKTNELYAILEDDEITVADKIFGNDRLIKLKYLSIVKPLNLIKELFIQYEKVIMHRSKKYIVIKEQGFYRSKYKDEAMYDLLTKYRDGITFIRDK